MISNPVNGRPKTVTQANLALTDTVLYTVPANIAAILHRIHVCNKTALAASVTVWVTSGGADTHIYSGKIVAGNDTLFPPMDIDHRMEAGAILKMKAGTAASLDVSATLFEISKNTAI